VKLEAENQLKSLQKNQSEEIAKISENFSVKIL